jgi:hypothetical protein
MLLIRDLGLLVTAALDARIHIWDLAARADRDGHGRRPAVAAALLPLRMALSGHTKGVIAMTYIPPQRYLVSASYDRTCLVSARPGRSRSWPAQHVPRARLSLVPALILAGPEPRHRGTGWQVAPVAGIESPRVERSVLTAGV